MVSALLGKVVNAVKLRAKRLGLKYAHVGREGNRKKQQDQRSVNTKYFDTWSPNIAYTLGYAWSDGAVKYKKKGSCVFQLNAATEDEQAILDIRVDMQSTHKISRLPSRLDGRGGPLTVIQISNRELVEKLMNCYGILPRKSELDLTLPRSA